MIFEEVTLYNYGIYKGLHTVSLDSNDPTKPVILIGAMNGAGKTTFLDALQLALYGKHAKCSNRGKLSYSIFLEKTINSYASDKTASVTLKFRHGEDTINSHHYEIERKWIKDQHKDCKENITVKLNGEVDSLLSDNWDEFVNEFIPQSISELFFFDGEKIENLADPKRSAELLKTGIEALLGLEMLTKLSTDLNIIKRRKQEKLLEVIEIDTLKSIESDLQKLEEDKKETNLHLDELYQQQEILASQDDALQLEFRAYGVDKLQIKEKLEDEKSELEKKIFEIEHDQKKLVSGSMPLSLLSALSKRAELQLNKEHDFKSFQNAESIILENKKILLDTISDFSIDDNIIVEISKKLDNAIIVEKQKFNHTIYLNSDKNIFIGLEDKISSEKLTFEELINKKQEIQDRLLLLHKKLATIPKLQDVQHLIEKSALHKEKTEILKKEIKATAERRLDLDARINNAQQKYEALLLKNNAVSFEKKRQAQIVEHVETLKEILESFNKDMISENISKLENRIKAKFDQLKRKNNLIDKIKISPVDFSITMFNENRKIISSERLSAGERQLFAIAILWGLADCSGKELPTIIDTPMGRLDGAHRKNLIHNYFPNASSQVILLSTDEEIYGQYYNDLKQYIAQQYNIIYNEDKTSSSFVKGYFGDTN
ncbi:DNA sulfur modification protein DndD [Enterobacter hormaechei]|uniref:DNA sulfur modification protein DndD n=1 Tax=Enterobacter hormaechei TaxID=158836 RepID=UPI001258A376|nr:DNA sulfur modification protein DndD [Enterobacter hormaechei]MCM7385691.1 DNA sulfur modification protein DndD [Enterobacter hormaechei]WLZ31697.1 DNA sulfur modification protein DndD [Enterobacter hormaechei]VAM23925.1 DNA sulfur modification protein DndD [Enterobacter hormaechei]VAM39606.1 DNA sulfur modification protein DndD [Enterobacter hormaechei]